MSPKKKKSKSAVSSNVHNNNLVVELKRLSNMCVPGCTVGRSNTKAPTISCSLCVTQYHYVCLNMPVVKSQSPAGFYMCPTCVEDLRQYRSQKSSRDASVSRLESVVAEQKAELQNLNVRLAKLESGQTSMTPSASSVRSSSTRVTAPTSALRPVLDRLMRGKFEPKSRKLILKKDDQKKTFVVVSEESRRMKLRKSANQSVVKEEKSGTSGAASSATTDNLSTLRATSRAQRRNNGTTDDQHHCPVCQKYFYRTWELSAHLRRDHSTENTHDTSGPSSISRPTRSARSSINPLAIAESPVRVEPRTQPESTSQNVNECSDCQQTFSTAANLKRHRLRAHRSNRKPNLGIKVDTKSKVFAVVTRTADMRNRRSLPSTFRPSIPISRMPLRQSSGASQRLLTIKEIKKEPDDYSEEAEEISVKPKYNSEKSDEESEEPEVDDSKKLKCSVCHLFFVGLNRLRIHKRFEHPEQKRSKAPAPHTHAQKVTNADFMTPKPTWTCTGCHKRFLIYRSITRHVGTCHLAKCKPSEHRIKQIPPVAGENHGTHESPATKSPVHQETVSKRHLRGDQEWQVSTPPTKRQKSQIMQSVVILEDIGATLAKNYRGGKVNEHPEHSTRKLTKSGGDESTIESVIGVVLDLVMEVTRRLEQDSISVDNEDEEDYDRKVLSSSDAGQKSIENGVRSLASQKLRRDVVDSPKNIVSDGGENSNRVGCERSSTWNSNRDQGRDDEAMEHDFDSDAEDPENQETSHQTDKDLKKTINDITDSLSQNHEEVGSSGEENSMEQEFGGARVVETGSPSRFIDAQDSSIDENSRDESGPDRTQNSGANLELKSPNCAIDADDERSSIDANSLDSDVQPVKEVHETLTVDDEEVSA